MRVQVRALAGALSILIAHSAGAQFLQYTPPGGPERRPEERREEVEAEIEQARVRLGPVRIAPWFAVKDVSYVRTLAGEEEGPSDVTATVGAGLRAWLRTGPKLVWTAQALPEYVWWGDREAARRLNGRYLAGGFAFFNRLTLEALASREEAQRILTPEVATPASARADRLRAAAEVEISGALSAFASATWTESESLVEKGEEEGGDAGRLAALDLLDRRERLARAGLRWRRGGWAVGLGLERSEAEFERDALDRSNQGTSPIVEAQFEGSRFFARTSLAARSLEATGGSEFVDYDGVTGDAAVVLGAGGRREVSLYGSRQLVYSLQPEQAWFEDDRLGAAFGFRLGRRTGARVYAETGAERYTALLPEAPRRRDDLFAYGGSLSFELGRFGALELQATRTELDSNLPGFDRDYTSIGTSFRLGPELLPAWD
jgi:hypothetical protein